MFPAVYNAARFTRRAVTRHTVVSFTSDPLKSTCNERVLRKRGVKIKAANSAVPDSGCPTRRARRGRHPRRTPSPSLAGHTFVDFEHGLNAAVARLRQALGDSAEQPRYVERLAKRGYRFAAKVQPRTTRPKNEEPTPVHFGGKHKAVPWYRRDRMLAAGCAVPFLFVSSPERRRDLYPGAFDCVSRDGSEPCSVTRREFRCFSWNGEKQDNFDIYVMPVRCGTPTRLTTDPAEDTSPAWSPDGRTLAFLRQKRDGVSELILVPAAGGPEHKIAETREQPWFAPRKSSAIAWSPDGRWIAASHREPGDPSEGIYLFSLTGEKQRLTHPIPGYRSDNMPAFLARRTGHRVLPASRWLCQRDLCAVLWTRTFGPQDRSGV